MKLLATFITAIITLSSVINAAIVEKIEIISPKDETVSEQLVLSRMKLHEGSRFSNELLSDDVKSLYESGFFSNVNCETIASGRNVILKVHVKGQPIIRRVVFKGNSEFETEDLVEKIELVAGKLLNMKTLASDKAALLAIYEDKSYYGTEINVETETMLDGQADVVWEIKEQKRYKVGDVTFVGNSSVESGELKDLIVTEESWFSYIFPVGFINKAAFDEDKRQIVKRYTDAGFLEAEVTDIVTKVDGDFLDVQFVVEEGDRFKVRNITIDGTEKWSGDELLTMYFEALGKSKLASLTKGEFYDANAERRLTDMIKSKYYREGYISLKVRSAHNKFRGLDNEVDVILTVKEGVEAKIRDVNIRGNSVTKDHVIRREVALLPGALADKRLVEATQRRLMNLNYFETVDVIPVATSREGEKDLDISVTEKSTGQFMVGAGFSTEDDIIASVELSQANFDLFDSPRFSGGGQKMRLRLQAGSTTNEFMLAFTEPWLYNKPLSLNTNFYVRGRHYDEYSQRSTGTNWSISQKMDMKYWRQTTGFIVEQVKIKNIDDNACQEIQDEEGRYNVVRLYQQWSRNSTDHFRFPTRGSKFSTRVDLQAEALGAYNSSYKFDINYSKFFRIAPESDWVLKLGARVAQVSSISGDEPAIFDRYFAGGPGTVRGFKFREVGPVGQNGGDDDPIGGQSMFTATAQLRIPIVDAVHFVTFADAGNVWADDWGYSIDEMNASVGIGFRLNVGIPITIDYGWPILTDQTHLEDAKGRLHFNIGFSY